MVTWFFPNRCTTKKLLSRPMLANFFLRIWGCLLLMLVNSSFFWRYNWTEPPLFWERPRKMSQHLFQLQIQASFSSFKCLNCPPLLLLCLLHSENALGWSFLLLFFTRFIISIPKSCCCGEIDNNWYTTTTITSQQCQVIVRCYKSPPKNLYVNLFKRIAKFLRFWC